MRTGSSAERTCSSFPHGCPQLAVSYDVHLRLEALLGHEDAMIVRYASGALQNITRALHLGDNSLSSHAMAAVQERSREHRREEFVQQRALAQISKAIRDIPADLRERRQESGRRRKSRAANRDPSESRSQSRPSSAASSRSTSSFVSARSSMTSDGRSSLAAAPAAIPLGSSPLIGRGGSGDSPHGIGPMRDWPAPPVSPLTQL